MTICVESSVEVDNFQIRAARIYLRCQLWGLVLKFWPSSCNCWEVLQPLNYDVLHVRYHIVYQIVKRVRGGVGGINIWWGCNGRTSLSQFQTGPFQNRCSVSCKFQGYKRSFIRHIIYGTSQQFPNNDIQYISDQNGPKYRTYVRPVARIFRGVGWEGGGGMRTSRTVTKY